MKSVEFPYFLENNKRIVEDTFKMKNVQKLLAQINEIVGSDDFERFNLSDYKKRLQFSENKKFDCKNLQAHSLLLLYIEIIPLIEKLNKDSNSNGAAGESLSSTRLY